MIKSRKYSVFSIQTVILLFILSLITVYSLLTTAHAQEPILEPPPEERLEGVVIKVLEESEVEFYSKKQLVQKAEVEILDGSEAGKIINLTHGTSYTPDTQRLEPGDKIILVKTKDIEGNDLYIVNDFIRRDSLLFLFAIFVGLTLLIARKRGLFSLVGMGLSFGVIFYIILPQIAGGGNPILVAVGSTILIIPLTFYLSHGFNQKTSAAVVGTFISLLVTGLLASLFIDISNLSGYASEQAGFLQVMHQGNFNIKGLLLAGIIIGVLGVLDDITISQSAIVHQLKSASPNIKFAELMARSMDIGRDHIASLVNTLILVYTGAALPLLLLFIDNPLPFSQVVNYEIIAEEIARTLIASIGLIIAVPITTFVAAWWVSRQKRLV